MEQSKAAQHNRHRAGAWTQVCWLPGLWIFSSTGHSCPQTTPWPVNVTGQSPRPISFYVWVRDLLWHLLKAQDTVVFKNSLSPKIQQKWQNRSQGPETVASCHLSGSVQHFRERKLGLPGHVFCRVGSLGDPCDSRIRSLLWLSTKTLETLTCPALSCAKWCLSSLPLQVPPHPPCLLIVCLLSGLKSMLRKDTNAGSREKLSSWNIFRSQDW